MGRTTKKLSDDEIAALPLKQKQYKRVVGDPKELYIWINPVSKKNPNGLKRFTLRRDDKFILASPSIKVI